MAGPGLQLFPPPPRQRQPSPNRRLRVKLPTPEPTAEKMESATSTKAPADFHELIIQVNSVPVSPSSSMEPRPSIVAPPPKAHLANTQAVRTPPQESRPVFDSPPRQRVPSPSLARKASKRTQDPRAPSPALSAQDRYYGQRSTNASPEPHRVPSPAFSTSETLVRANSSATHMQSRSPQEVVPMRSMFPVYDPTVPLTQQAYKPTQTSPTYNPSVQVSRSPYSPNFYIPHSSITDNGPSSPPPRPFFTPSQLLDNLWTSCNGQTDPAVQMYTLRMHRATEANPTITFGPTPSLPFYSLAQSNLARGHEVESIMNELLIQRHHPTQPRVLPVAHLDLIAPPSLENNIFDPLQQEPTTLLTSIYPKLAALAALDAAANSPAASHIALNDPGATSPAAQRLAQDVLMGAAQRECCALAWTRESPQQQTNPWAQHLPSEGTYQLHHPTLGTFPIQIEGDCSIINKPSTRPQTAIYGHNMPITPQSPRKQASITILNPYILSPTSPRAAAFSPLQPPPRMDSLTDSRPISITPSEMSFTQLPTATDAAQDDAMLARIDFNNDALMLNLGALSHFGNPFLVDVMASTLLAVAVAEAVRGRQSKKANLGNFEPPPPSAGLGQKKETTAKAFKESFVEGFEAWGGRNDKTKKAASSLRKWSLKSSTTGRTSKSEGSMDKDIELGEWYGQGQTKHSTKDGKQQKTKEKDDNEDKLPLVTRTIINVLTFSFKAVVWVLRIAIKVVAGVVVMITRNFSKL